MFELAFPQIPSRRRILKMACVALGACMSNATFGQSSLAFHKVTKTNRLFVPGYLSDEAYTGDQLIVDVPGVSRVTPGWNGGVTLLSMLEITNRQVEPIRAAYPLNGHGLALFPSLGVGVFAGMESDSTIGFNLDTLDLTAMARPLNKEWLFGGHAARMPDGKHVAVAERHPALPRSGNRQADIARMSGRIVIRDAKTLTPVGEFPCYGIRPHDIYIGADGRHIAVANYGSTVARETRNPTGIDVLAPGIAVIELASGKLMTWVDGVDGLAELRHLVAPRLNRIFAMTVRMGLGGSPNAELAEPEPNTDPPVRFLPSLPIRVANGRAMQLMTDQVSMARQGLSMVYDDRHDEVLATFPSSHCVVVFNGASGNLTKLIHTDALGLKWPCGLALSPDGSFYCVSGYWNGLLTLATSNHQVQSMVSGPQWWGHSHTVIG